MAETSDTAHAFSFKSLEGKPLPLSAFKGKPLLIVNTASKCGFTPQYQGLEELWRATRDRGLVVLGVPCNDFGGQEPGSAQEIATFCEVRFGVDFPLTEKVHVKGDEAHPLFRWLVAKGAGRPRWNFYKYLIDRDGNFVDWFSSMTSPKSGRFQKAVEKLLAG
ncbi:MAG TPA: glutathione peroxidase [Alphaproteobacteria bacterium]|nr:glutathione peroxidase [Alphaproteobacteria bacterium]